MWRKGRHDEEFVSYLSPKGHLVLRILRLLAQAQVTKPLKTMCFEFAIQVNGYTAPYRLLTRNGEGDEKTTVIAGLLKALQRRTNAEIEMEEVKEGRKEWIEHAEIKEGTFPKRLKVWKMEDWKMEGAEVDEWEKVLLNDSDVDL